MPPIRATTRRLRSMASHLIATTIEPTTPLSHAHMEEHGYRGPGGQGFGPRATSQTPTFGVDQPQQAVDFFKAEGQ